MDFSKNKDIFKSNTYNGYEINGKYYMSRKNLNRIIKTLIYCRDNIDRPLAARYVLDLNNDHSFDINKLTRKIKSYFKDNYKFIYSFEYVQGKGLHLEIMMITDRNKYSPETVYNMLKKICFNLEGTKITKIEYNDISTNETLTREVAGIGYLPIEKEYLATGDKVGHNLKNPIHFLACIRRASYLAKQDDKEQVQYRKKFNII